MEHSKRAWRLTSACCLLALAACSGGGGGSGTTPVITTPTTPANTTPTTPTTPTVSIGAPDNANVAIEAATFNFTTNLPPVGTVFNLLGPAVKVTSTTVEAANKGTTGTLTYRGMVSGVPTFDVSIPALNLTATNVHADSTPAQAASGGSVLLGVGVLKYTAAGAWGYTPGPGTGITYAGATASGSGTPIANVPTAGSATYSGTGGNGAGTVGIYFVPNGSGGISTGALTGDITVAVNFGTGGVTGSLSNMTAKPGDGGATTPWNNVSLSANVNRLTTNASFVGTTSTSGAPAGAGNNGFSSAATGGLGGAFFGPNADEVGGTWTLTDPGAAGGGKTAFGAFGATSTGCSGCGPSGSGSGQIITAPGAASFGGATPITENGTTPNLTSTPPAAGTVFPLMLSAMIVTPTSAKDANISGGTATFQGTTTSGVTTYPIIELKVPSISLDAPNLKGSGTPVTLADASQVNAVSGVLNYASLGLWGYFPQNGTTAYLGEALTGYQTQTGHVPTSGIATYTGLNGSTQGSAKAGGVAGQIYAPTNGGTKVLTGGIGGDATLNVNFTSGAVNGQLSNMFSTNSTVGTAPWNSVTLSGSLSGAGLGGTTSTGGAPATAGVFGMTSAATGKFNGALYGPHAEELGLIWSLSESTADGGRAVLGSIAATKQ